MTSENNESGNKAVAECLRQVEKFLAKFDELRIEEKRIIDFGGEPPPSYSAGLERSRSLLLQLAVFLSDKNGKPHVGAPVINPSVTPIINFEKDILEETMKQIDDAKRVIDEGPQDSNKPYEGFWKWVHKALGASDIILGSAEKFVPGASFVNEFMKQIKNWIP